MEDGSTRVLHLPPFILYRLFPSPIVMFRQNAANLLPLGKECGALPSRRYASKVLEAPLYLRSIHFSLAAGY